MKINSEIAKKLNKGSVFGMKLFKKYLLGSELARLSKSADLTQTLCEQYEALLCDIDNFFARSDRQRYARLFEIDKELKNLKFRLCNVEQVLKEKNFK